MLSTNLVLCSALICVIVWLSDESMADKVLKRVHRDTQTYTTKYDNIDIDSILASNRLLKNYVNCLLEKGPCTADGKELKKYLPDAIATECSKCSRAQKKIAGKVLENLLLHHKDDWDKLTAKYDPERKVQAKYFDENDDYSDLEEA